LEQPEKVSIIIALYNAEKFISDTLFSVTNQTWANIEIIVVNDGSKDSSREVVERLGILNLNLYNRENKGQCAASNYGISKSSGELIKFLDADDILAHDCIEKMVLKWRENPNRLVFGEWHYFLKEINKIKISNYNFFNDFDNSLDWYISVLNTSESMLAGWIWLIPKSILNKAGGWDERLHLMNDFEFSTRLILHSDGIGFANDAIHYYRKGISDSMTSKMNKNIAFSIYTGVNEACVNILEKEDSLRFRKVFADKFQQLVFEMYPQYMDITDKMNHQIKSLGGSNIKPQAGKVFKVLNRILPWKIVMYLQTLLHKTIWRPILKYKYKIKINNEFSN